MAPVPTGLVLHTGQSDHPSPFDDSEDLSYPGHDWRILYMAASLFSVSRVSSDTVEILIDPCEYEANSIKSSLTRCS